MNVYLVTGRTGAYEDYQEWNVCAYRDQQMAERHAENANKWVTERIGPRLRSGDRALWDERHDKCEKARKESCPWDKYFQLDAGTGTYYRVEEVPMFDTLGGDLT